MCLWWCPEKDVLFVMFVIIPFSAVFVMLIITCSTYYILYICVWYTCCILLYTLYISIDTRLVIMWIIWINGGNGLRSHHFFSKSRAIIHPKIVFCVFNFQSASLHFNIYVVRMCALPLISKTNKSYCVCVCFLSMHLWIKHTAGELLGRSSD